MAGIKTAAMLGFFGVSLTGTALTNAAKYDHFWFKTSNEDLVTPGVGATGEAPVDWAAVTAGYVDPIKALNPDCVLGLYVGAGAEFHRQLDPAYEFTSDAQALHQPDGDPLEFDVGAGNVHYRWTDYADAAVRSDHITKYLAFCATYGFDQIFFDSWLPSFYSAFILNDPESATGSLEGATHTTAYWITTLPLFTAALAEALEATDRALYANGIAPLVYDPLDPEDLFMGQDNSNIVDYATGTLDETFYLAYGDADVFAGHLEAIARTQAKGGAVFVNAMPWLYSIAPPAFAIPAEDTLRRYYLTAYMLAADARSSFGFQPYDQVAYFGLDVTFTASRVYWHADYDIDYGTPVSPYVENDGVYSRDYSNGVVAVNPGTDALVFTRPGAYRVWGAGATITVGSGGAPGITLPARSGIWLESVPPVPESPTYRVFIRGDDYERVGELTDWSTFDCLPVFNAVGNWTLEASSLSLEAALLTRTGGIIVTRELYGIERTIFSGPVSELTWTANTIRASGPSDEERLEAPALPDTLGPPYTQEYDVRTGAASSVMISLVQANLQVGFCRADRGIPQATWSAPTPPIGGTVTSRGRFQSILAILQEIAATPIAGGLGFSVLQSDTVANSIEFKIYQPIDRSSDAKFGIDLGTASDFEDTWSAPEANYLYVLMGDGLGENRSVLEDGDAASIAEVGRQIERVIDIRDVTDPSEGNQRLAEALAGAISIRRSAIVPFDTPSLQYGQDYELGDLVTVVTPGGERVEIIREVEISLGPDGAVITPIVGRGDGTEGERIASHIAAVQDRLGNIERNWTVPDSSITLDMMTSDSVGALQIINGTVTPVKLHAIDTAASDEIPVYDSATGNFEWVTLAALAAATTFTTLTTSGAVSVGGVLGVTGAVTGSSTVQGTRLISTVATGTAPLTVASTTLVTNLNADLLDGHDSVFFATAAALAGYLPLTGGALTGALSITPTNDVALQLRHTAGGGVTSIGSNNSATPDFLVKNNATTQIGRLTTAGVFLAGSQTTAVTNTADKDVQARYLWVTDGTNSRHIRTNSDQLQISQNNGTGIHLTIDSAGFVTIHGLTIDQNLDPPLSNGDISPASQVKAFAYVGAAGSASLGHNYNIASVARNGTGDFTVTIDRDFSSATYAVLVTVLDNAKVLTWRINGQAGGSFDVHFRDNTGALSEPVAFSVACLGTLV